jgi:hypothetical protein
VLHLRLPFVARDYRRPHTHLEGGLGPGFALVAVPLGAIAWQGGEEHTADISGRRGGGGVGRVVTGGTVEREVYGSDWAAARYDSSPLDGALARA